MRAAAAPSRRATPSRTPPPFAQTARQEPLAPPNLGAALACRPRRLACSPIKRSAGSLFGRGGFLPRARAPPTLTVTDRPHVRHGRAPPLALPPPSRHPPPPTAAVGASEERFPTGDPSAPPTTRHPATYIAHDVLLPRCPWWCRAVGTPTRNLQRRRQRGASACAVHRPADAGTIAATTGRVAAAAAAVAASAAAAAAAAGSSAGAHGRWTGGGGAAAAGGPCGRSGRQGWRQPSWQLRRCRRARLCVPGGELQAAVFQKGTVWGQGAARGGWTPPVWNSIVVVGGAHPAVRADPPRVDSEADQLMVLFFFLVPRCPCPPFASCLWRPVWIFLRFVSPSGTYRPTRASTPAPAHSRAPTADAATCGCRV